MAVGWLGEGSQRDVVYLGWPITPSYIEEYLKGEVGRKSEGNRNVKSSREMSKQIPRIL
jgi:hypothetical protein